MPYLQAELECPDYWRVVPLGASAGGRAAAAGLSAIKLSQGGKEMVYVGATQPRAVGSFGRRVVYSIRDSA